MLEEIFHWHPKFEIHRLASGDISLISSSDERLIDVIKYPLLAEIDGQTTTKDILKKSKQPLDDIKFFLHFEKMIKDGIITKKVTKESLEETQENETYAHVVVSPLYEYYYTNKIEITDLTKQWINNLYRACNKYDQHLTVILTRDLSFLDINFLSKNTDRFIAIELSSSEISISPIFQHHEIADFFKLQGRLKRNLPMTNFITRSSTCMIRRSGIEPINFDSHLSELNSLVTHTLNTEKSQLTTLNLKSKEIDFHDVCLDSPHLENFSDQLNISASTESSKVDFFIDGGYRTEKPQDIALRMSKLVSPKTGVISHLKPLALDSSSNLKIFHSVFNKTPSPNSLGALTVDSFKQSCLGKGVDSFQCMASALGEALERSNAQYRGDEPLLKKRSSELGEDHYVFQDIAPYSNSQYDILSKPTTRLNEHSLVKYTDEPIHWLKAHSLVKQDRKIWIPMTLCLANTGLDEEKFGRWTSNGAACGSEPSEAICQGIFELIERDAVAIWWYNKIKRPAFEFDHINNEKFSELKTLIESDYKLWILDLTCDTKVPVMAAIGQHKSNGSFCFGFGCHINQTIAVLRAVTELAQLLVIRDKNDTSFNFNDVDPDSFLFPSPDSAEKTETLSDIQDFNLLQKSITDHLLSLGIETVAFNYSRNDVFMYTIKVFAPGLAHIWPQFANKRIFDTPVKLGWLRERNTESLLNPQGLFL